MFCKTFCSFCWSKFLEGIYNLFTPMFLQSINRDKIFCLPQICIYIFSNWCVHHHLVDSATCVTTPNWSTISILYKRWPVPLILGSVCLHLWCTLSIRILFPATAGLCVTYSESLDLCPSLCLYGAVDRCARGSNLFGSILDTSRPQHPFSTDDNESYVCNCWCVEKCVYSMCVHSLQERMVG